MQIISEQVVKKAQVVNDSVSYEIDYSFSNGIFDRGSFQIYQHPENRETKEYVGSILVENDLVTMTIPYATNMPPYLKDLEEIMAKIKEDIEKHSETGKASK